MRLATTAQRGRFWQPVVSQTTVGPVSESRRALESGDWQA
jgi:hypothetical protein